MKPVMKLITGLFFCASMQTILAQTNVIFQNCRVGDIVRVKSDHPIVVLSSATLLEIGSNTVTVATAYDRFMLAKTDVMLTPLTSHAASPAGNVPKSPATPPSSVAAPIFNAGQTTNLLETMESIRAAVIDPHKMDAFKEIKPRAGGGSELVVDPNSTNGQARYDKANAYYNNTMKGVLAGTVSQDDLVRQAKDELKQIDQFKPDGVDTSDYAQQIETLRDFVKRSEAGEKFDFQTNVQ